MDGPGYYSNFNVKSFSSIIFSSPSINCLFDRYGRRVIILTAVGVNIICGITCALSPNVTVFLVARFILANLASAKDNCNYVMSKVFITEMDPAIFIAGLLF